MASNKVNIKNSNVSRSDEILGSNSMVTLNSMVLLVRAEHVDSQPIEPEIFTETSFRELCVHTNPVHIPHAVEILSPHKVCLTYQQGIILGHVAGGVMAVESWMDFPILVMVVIMKRAKVDKIVEARQKHRELQRERGQQEIDKLTRGQHDLKEEFNKVAVQKEMLTQLLNDNAEKQTNLLKVVEQLTEKITKLEMQPLHTQGFMTSSSKNISNTFGNLSTSFQVKADIDIGKFIGTEHTPMDEVNFDQWCIDVKSYQFNYPGNILLPAIWKSIVGKAKSIIRHLGSSYTVEEVIAVLTQEYEGVDSSEMRRSRFSPSN